MKLFVNFFAFLKLFSPKVIVKEMLVSVKSPDPATRRMSLVFFICMIGIGITASIYVQRYLLHKSVKSNSLNASQLASKNISDFIQKQSDQAKHRNIILALGNFNVDLKALPLPEGQRQPRGVFNVAEVEIVVECDIKETKDFLEKNLPYAQDQITNVFTSMERDDLMTKDGKKKLKKRLIKQLNNWLPKGEVHDLFFNRIVIH